MRGKREKGEKGEGREERWNESQPKKKGREKKMGEVR
jgi:hypothetical protein